MGGEDFSMVGVARGKHEESVFNKNNKVKINYGLFYNLHSAC
jgi:hypothetical protein